MQGNKGLLKRGEQKSLQTDRVVLVPGPDEEIQNVRRMYERFTADGLTERQIAQWLNSEGIVHTELARSWSAAMVHQVLTNEKYIGNNIYNRVSFKLKKKRVRNAREMWVRRDGAFSPIVEPSMFHMARGIIAERGRRFSDEELLAKLRALLEKHGSISAELIDNADAMPSSSAFQSRFGSLIKAYQRVGFTPDRDYRYVEINRHLRTLRSPFEDDVIKKLEKMGAGITRNETGQLLINGEYTAEIIFTRRQQTAGGMLRWLINMDQASVPDISVVVRMDATNKAPTDFYLLPRIDVRKSMLRLSEYNGAAIDTYRYDTLNFFVAMAARSKIEVAA